MEHFNVPIPQLLSWLAMVVTSLAIPVAGTVVTAAATLTIFHHKPLWPTRLLLLLLAPFIVLYLAFACGQHVTELIPPHTPATALRIAHLNSRYYELNVAAKVRFAEASQADIVSLVEVRGALSDTLIARKTYPYNARSPKSGIPMLLLSRWPVTAVQSWGPRLQLYKIEHPTNPFYLLQVHVLSPSSPDELLIRNQQLAALSAATLPTPLIAVGDFNTTGWDPTLNTLRHKLSLVTSYAPTFPAILPLAPIDLMFTTPQTPRPTITRIRVPTTDHLGLVADFPTLPR